MYEVSEKSKRTLTLYQKQWTELLSTVSIKPIKIARTWMNGITPGRRLFVSDYHWNKPYQYRECMHNEIPYDLDVYNYELLKMELQPTLDFLNSEHIPYVKSGSGGNKSIHVSCCSNQPTIVWCMAGERFDSLSLIGYSTRPTSLWT